MAIYIAPFKNEYNKVEGKLTEDIDFCEVYYNEDAGPFGFESNEISLQILKEIIYNLTWFDHQEGAFHVINLDFIQKNRTAFYNVFGLVFNSKNLEKDIEDEKERKTNEGKNKLYARYGKPLINTFDTCFSTLVNSRTKKYNAVAINSIFSKTKEFMIFLHADRGRYIMVNRDSKIFHKIIDTCLQKNENINEVPDSKFMPYW